jgi:RHS repeat-associated protein
MDARPAPHNLAPSVAALFGPARPRFPKNGLGLFWSSVSVSRYDTEEPFGVELPPIQDATGNTHKFTGQEYDASTGLYNYHARMMAPNFGRFTSPDNGVDQHPDAPQSWNLYAYCWNNPVNRNDPDGRIAPLVAAWMAAEVALTLWDVAETTQTLTSPDSTTSERVVTVVGLGVGIGTIGGGYSAGGKKLLQMATRHGDDVFKATTQLGSLRSRLANLFEKNLDNATAVAAGREAAGDVVKLKPSGDPYNHVRKFDQGRKSATKALDQLKRIASDQRGTPQERAQAQELLSQYSKRLDAAEQAAKRAEQDARELRKKGR